MCNVKGVQTMAAKEEIREIALRLFSKEGYESVGVARIVAQAGVTKPTLYHHFGNKDGLLSDIIDTYGKSLGKLFASSLVYEGDVIGAIDQLVIKYVDFAKANPVFFRLYKQLYQSPLESSSYKLIKPFYDEVIHNVDAFFGTVSIHHTNLKGKTSWMSFSLIGLMDTYILHHLNNDDIATLNDATCSN